MDLNKLQFQKLDLAGVKTLALMAFEEGWNPGVYDVEAYYATDPDGFYGYYFDGELIAGGSIVSYEGAFGFMGFFIVKPEFRGYGIGRKLWYQRRDTLLSRLKPGASIGMDGVVEMQPFYNRGGFEIAFRDTRHEVLGRECVVDQNVSVIEDDDFDKIHAYDSQCFGFDRRRFLAAWLKLKGLMACKYLYNDEVRGFAAVRQVGNGYKIGPLFADNYTIAVSLFDACLNHSAGQPLFLDIPVVNLEAVKLTEKYDMKYVFECARMYYGNAPDLPVKKIFGITTFELG